MRYSSSTILKALAPIVALTVYLRVIRPWQLRWGATDEEVARRMPGDEIAANPHFDATRAMTVHATPEAIWPWLVQMGYGRAGWYSYDWIDNLGKPSATRIIPSLQHIAIGDLVPISPDSKVGLWVRDFKENHWLLWGDKEGRTTWLWMLDRRKEGSTRLITRVRMRYVWTSPAILFNLLLDVGDIVMMRKCMFGIKRRAETGIPGRPF